MAAGTLFHQAFAPYLALGVGGAGGRAAAAGCLMGFGERAPWAACDTHAARLLSTGLPEKLLCELPSGAETDSAAGQAVAARAEELRAWAQRRRAAVLLGDLGESAACALLPAVAAAFSEQGLFVCVAAIEPSAAAGPERTAPAERAALRLDAVAALFLTLRAEPLLAPLGEACTVERVASATEGALLGVAEAFLGVWAAGGTEPACTPEGLLSALRGAGRVTAAIGCAQGPAAPLAAVREARSERWFPAEEQTGRMSLVALLVSGRELSLAETQEIHGLLQSGRDSEALTRLGVGQEACLGDEARCLLLARAGPSPNVVAFR